VLVAILLAVCGRPADAHAVEGLVNGLLKEQVEALEPWRPWDGSGDPLSRPYSS
jgi:hypothetical protein